MTRPTLRLATRAVAAIAAATLVLGACSSTPEEPEVNRAVISTGESLPAADVDQLQLPFSFQELPAFTLPFDAVPQSMDGILLGLRETAGVLEFAAITTDGEELWTTQRPATCSGFTLTRAGDAPIAVLTDVESTTDALSQVTASAYDLRTGELQWGPVPVEGPWHGPGVVFAEAAPASAMGEVGARQALDPATGEPLDIDGEVIGEFDGTFLAVTGSGGESTIAASGGATWEIPVADLVSDDVGDGPQVTALPGVSAPEGFALLSVDGAQEAALVDLADGEILSTSATSAAWDAAAEIVVATEPRTLAGFTPEGPAWNRELGEGLRISATGGVLTYLRSDGAVQVVNAITGEDAVGYDPDATSYAVPLLITSDGAGVFKLDDFTLIGTHADP